MHILQSILQDIVKNSFGAHIDTTCLSFDQPPKPELGDVAINVFGLSKTLREAPNAISAKLAEAISADTRFTSAVGMGGYVNVKLSGKLAMELLGSLSTASSPSNNKTIVVDYIGANAGKPLHIAHICTPCIGQALINAHSHLGYKVIGDSHFGDWGGVFGKILWAYKNNVVSPTIEESDAQIAERGSYYLVELYQKATKLIGEDESGEIDRACRLEFKILSDGNPESTKLWQYFTEISIQAIERQLDLINVHATYNIGESFYEGPHMPRPNNEDYPQIKFDMKSIVQELIEKGVATQNDDGSVGVVFPEESKIPSCVLQKKDGTSLYLTSDLSAIKYRLTNGWNPSKILYCIDIRQQLHMRQAFAIAQAAWPELMQLTELFHAYNGFIKLKEWAMSTRHGTVIFLDKLLEEGFSRTKTLIEEKGSHLADEDIQAIAVGAIKYSYLMQDREKDVVFDWDKALNFEGHSGPYIQYAYVRATKILDKAREAGLNWNTLSPVEMSEYDRLLLMKLARFEENVRAVTEKYKPHFIAIYAYELATLFSSFYVHSPKLLEESNTELQTFRLALVAKTVETLKASFDILAIDMPKEM